MSPETKRKAIAVAVAIAATMVLALIDAAWAGTCVSRAAVGGGTITSCTGGPVCTTRSAVGGGIITTCR
jgi:hypothetical protein